MDTTPTMPSQEQLALLSQLLRDISRRRLSADDAQDFAQSVHVRLLERKYDVFQRFSGRSSLRTFLTVVLNRMLLDWRNETRGKWRPSAAARRLGPHAVGLERLLYRDGHSAHEAIELLLAQPSAPPVSALRAIIDQLPVRLRRRMLPDESLRDLRDTSVEDPIDAAWCRDRRRQVRSAVAKALRKLPPEDRRLLCMRYQQGKSVQSMAQSLDVDPRLLYRRFGRVLRSLRKAVDTDRMWGNGGLASNA